MEMWKSGLILGVLVVYIVSQGVWANPVQNTGIGRSAKVLEDPIVVQQDEASTDLEDSNRSLSVERNMMLYRTVFTLSLKLLTAFVIVKLLGYALTSTGVIRPGGGGWGWQQPMYYSTIDANQAVGWTQQQPGGGAGGGAGGLGAGTVLATGGAATGLVGTGGAVVTTTTTGAAAGAYTGNGGTYITAASTNPRPAFLVPAGPLPRLRFGPRHPPFRMQPMMAQPMGPDTHLIETHSHMFVMPDGSQARVPVLGQAKLPAAGDTSQETSVKISTSSSESATTSERPSADSISITNESPSPIAQRRSSNVYREKLYDDWILHYNPGTRSL